MLLPSVIVDDLYVCGSVWSPDEADTPLLINTDTVLSSPVIFQRFQPVAGRYLQILKNCRPVQLRKLSESRSFDVHPALYAFAVKEGLGVFALEALDRHGWR
jgi:hypothetical protein